MQLTYKLEQDDYWRYNTFVIGRVPAMRRQVIVSSVLLPAVLTVYFWLFHLLDTVWLVVFGVSACILWAAFMMVARKRTYAKAVQARPSALGLHTLALDADGVREQSDIMEGRVKWPKISEIAQSEHLIIFFIGPRFGFLVPKRAFPNPQQAQAFLETAQAYRAAALNGTTPALPPVPETWPPAPQRLL